jgi:hypothetical protein
MDNLLEADRPNYLKSMFVDSSEDRYNKIKRKCSKNIMVEKKTGYSYETPH